MFMKILVDLQPLKNLLDLGNCIQTEDFLNFKVM